MSCAGLVELAIPPALKYIGSGAFLDCTVLRRLVKIPGTRMAKSLCGRKCFCHLSGHEMATLAAHDPGRSELSQVPVFERQKRRISRHIRQEKCTETK